MKRFLSLFSGFMLMLGLCGMADAYTINFDYIAVGNQFTSPYAASVTVEDFEDDPYVWWQWSGSGEIVLGDVVNKYSAPAGVDSANKDLSKYVTVPDPDGGSVGSILVTELGNPGEAFNYFGIWWGSMDAYNTLTFYRGGAEVLSFTGAAVITDGASYGDQLAYGSNHYVNFFFSGSESFDSFKMSSSNFAFEADNIAIGNVPVPVPPAIWLLGSGLVGLLSVRRKFRR